jgi:uncharacterized membrane protein YsdA (DUF1294 family)
MINLGRLNTFDRFCIIWFSATNLCAFTAFGFDKWRATRSGRRIQEMTLALLAALGGWPAGLIGMKLFRHKTAKWTFKLKYGLALFPFAAEIWAWWHYR